MTVWPRPMRPGSIRWRLGLAYALVVAVMLGLLLVLVGGIVERTLIENTASRLEIEAGLIAADTGGKKGVTATDLAAGDLAGILGGQETAVVILDPDGMTLASEPNGAPPDVVAARLDASRYRSILATGESTDAVLPAGTGSGRMLVVAVPVQLRTAGGPPSDKGRPDDKGPPPGRGLGNQNPGQGGDAATGTAPNAIAQLGVSLEPVDAALGDLRASLLLTGFGVFLVAVVIAWAVTSIGLRPLTRVAQVADQIATGELSARANLPEGTDEIGRLGRAFDEMVDRVEATLRSQRQFAADASHELRSPLTVLGGFVDVLARGDLAGSEAGARTLAAMRREIDRLSRLATDLLLLSQLEAGGGKLERSDMDLGDLVADVADAARVMADGRRVEIERDGPLPVMADRDRLTQAVMNLVDNAVRHTPANGLITLATRRDGPSALVIVSNEGEAIGAEHVPHLFERFYRVRRADGSDRPGDHAGLGLPIVRAIAEALGGSVGVASDTRTTRFEIRLPLLHA
jgi:two-component system OmpR family sensor kinase